eukprot:scaffold102190_cov54-Attheya_sp.AAC.2
MDRANELIQIFHQHVDVAKIVEAARSVTESKRLELERASRVNTTAAISSHATTRSNSRVDDDSSIPARKRIRLRHETTPHPTTAVSMVREDELMTTSTSGAATTTTNYKTRDDIERDANSAGAMLVST